LPVHTHIFYSSTVLLSYYRNLFSFYHVFLLFLFFTLLTTTDNYSLSLHDALPIFAVIFPIIYSYISCPFCTYVPFIVPHISTFRSEEHTSELQSRFDLVCRLLLEKKKILMSSSKFLKYYLFPSRPIHSLSCN